MMTEVKLCECGCGHPSPIATGNWHKRRITKGQPLRLICGHHRRGVAQSIEEKVKRVKTWGVNDFAISPYLPGNRIVRYFPEQDRWYCSTSGSKKPHARAVYEHFIGPPPEGWVVHHKNGCTGLEDDRPDNLVAVSWDWNTRYFPVLAKCFDVHESVVTKAYLLAIEEGLMPNDAIFRRVCQILLMVKT